MQRAFHQQAFEAYPQRQQWQDGRSPRTYFGAGEIAEMLRRVTCGRIIV
jgi:hypothetical protein